MSLFVVIAGDNTRAYAQVVGTGALIHQLLDLGVQLGALSNGDVAFGLLSARRAGPVEDLQAGAERDCVVLGLKLSLQGAKSLIAHLNELGLVLLDAFVG